jgi:hypothetical protein
MTEIKYPIYRFEARWTEKRVKMHDYDDTHGLPATRFWNGTGFSRMFKEDQTRKQLDIVLLEFWQKYERKGEEIELFSLHAELERRETWCLTWFSHYTFDVGQTDEEALDSFQSYVNRMLSIQDKDGIPTLMGAEDRWRWCGGGPDDERMPAPCRCKYCKEQGVLRIGH